MKQRKLTIFISGILILAGCSSKEVPLHQYTLQTPQNIVQVSSSRYSNESIKVMYPESLKEKMGQKMHFSYSLSEQGTYLNSQWSNDIGKLLQGIIIQSLTESRMFKGVVSYASTAQADYRLESTIFDFSHRVRDKESHAIVSVQFSLVSTHTGKLLKSKRFSYAEPTHTTNAVGYARSSNIAMERLGKDLISWLR